MPQQPMYPAVVNSLQTELTAAIDETQTTITVTDATLLPAAPNLAVIGSDETAETILYTGKSGNNLLGVTRGFQGTAKGWSAGVKVARYFTAYDHDTFRGNIQDHESRIRALESHVNVITNGNFDIWQRGTPITANNNFATGNSFTYGADRWNYQIFTNGTAAGTVTVSRQTFDLGQTAVPNNPKFFSRFDISNLGALPANGALIRQRQNIENVTLFSGGKATVSFWAKASLSREIAVILSQNFGQGGSPSSIVDIGPANGWGKINLTTSWQKFTLTYDVPSVANKTLGTGNDNLTLTLLIYKQDDTFTTVPSGSVGSFVNGAVDIAQVQVCAGDVALPFQPRSFAEELALCQRYYEKSYNYDVFPGSAVPEGSIHLLASDNANTKFVIPTVGFSVKKRIAPTVTIYDTAGNIGKITTRDVSDNPTHNVTPSIGATNVGTSAFKVKHQGAVAGISFQWTADSEL